MKLRGDVHTPFVSCTSSTRLWRPVLRPDASTCIGRPLPVYSTTWRAAKSWSNQYSHRERFCAVSVPPSSNPVNIRINRLIGRAFLFVHDLNLDGQLAVDIGLAADGDKADAGVDHAGVEGHGAAVDADLSVVATEGG